jgi:Xaa-Pro aminopeptidase
MNAKLQALVQQHGNVLIERQENFSLAFGGRGHINVASEKACAVLLLQPGRKTLISNNIEIFRLQQEEAEEASEWDIRYYPWYEDARKAEIIRELCGDARFVTDSELNDEFAKLRTVFTDRELAIVREQGKITAAGLESVCEQLKPGMTEFAAAGLIAQTFLAQGIDVVVNLVGSDERLHKYRHFLPTASVIERHAILAIVTRYKGIMVSVTRSVHFGAMSDEAKRAAAAARRLDANLTAATRSGQSYGELFDRLVQWYAETGYPDQWQNHHQGGMAGFAPRETRLLPGSTLRIEQNQIFAWNPSLPGAKSEDTSLVTAGAPEVLTWTGNFPYEDIQVGDTTIRKTATLIR